MAQPVISSASYDKDGYATGETATLTVVRADVTSTTVTDDTPVTATDNVTGESTEAHATLTVEESSTDPTTIGVSSATGRTFTAVSDDGTTAVYSTTV
jgi:hypothetical protein